MNEIAKIFALAVEYEKNTPMWPYMATPKLNGLRVMWVPGVGFATRHGKPYADGVLPHIEGALRDTKLWLDGELYCHGMTLQDINARAGVIRETPHPENHKIVFNVFDSPHLTGSFAERQFIIEQALPITPYLATVPYYDCSCCNKGDARHEAFVSAGYEGTVYKHHGHYQPGRTRMMIKRKAWMDEDFPIVELVRGREGKYDDTLGAIICRHPDGHTFKVGSFDGINDDARHEIWVGPKPKTAKVKFLGYTNDKVPYNSRVMAVDYQ